MAVTANLDENTLASLTKRTSLFGGNIAIVDKKTTVMMSNTMTGIQNAFNRILTYSKNMNKIQQAKLEATSYSNKEAQLEAPRAAPVAQASALSTSDDALADLLPDLLKVVKKLDDKLQDLDLNGSSLDLDIDIDRRPRRPGRPRPGARPRPGQSAGRSILNSARQFGTRALQYGRGAITAAQGLANAPLVEGAAAGGTTVGGAALGAAAGILATVGIVYGTDKFIENTNVGARKEQEEGTKRFGLTGNGLDGFFINGKGPYTYKQLPEYYQMVSDGYGANARGGSAERAREYVRTHNPDGTLRAPAKKTAGAEAPEITVTAPKREAADKKPTVAQDKASRDSAKLNDKLVKTAAKAATVQAKPVKKEEPVKAMAKQGNEWTGKVSAFIGDTYKNVTSFMGGFLSKLASLGGQISDFISGGVQNVAGWFGFGGGPGFQQADLRGARGEWARDAGFINGVNALAKKYDVDAGDLLGLMWSESGINAQARNPSGATGLIQFMPDTARALGTTTDAIYRMNRTQQLALVDKFFQMNKLPSGATAGQLYASVFLPAYSRKADNFVVARAVGANDAGKVQPKWYSQNAGLDMNRDGAITIADLGQRLSSKRQEIGLGPSKAGSGFRALGNLAMGAYNAAGSAFSSLSDFAQRATGFKPPLASIRSRSGASATVAAPYAKNFQGFINDLEATGYKIRALGGYDDRANVNNPKYKSFHAAGAAIDINPAQNPNGKARITDMPIAAVNMLIRKWGLGWGFNFRGISDAMHFSIADFEGGSVKIPRVLNTGRSLMMMPGEVIGQYAAATGKSTGSAVSPAKPQVAPASTLPGKAQTVAIDKKKVAAYSGAPPRLLQRPAPASAPVVGPGSRPQQPQKQSAMQQFLGYFNAA